MAVVLKLSGKSLHELLTELCREFESKYESNYKVPSCETLELLLTFLELENLQQDREEAGFPRPVVERENGLSLGSNRKYDDRAQDTVDFTDALVQKLCKGCIHLLMQRDSETETEYKNSQNLLHQIIIECCKISNNSLGFVLKFCIINTEEFTKASKKGFMINKERINTMMLNDKAEDITTLNTMPISGILGLLLSLTKTESGKKQITVGAHLDGGLFNSLLELLTCDADDAIMAMASQIVSLCLITDVNKQALWEKMEEHSKENKHTTPYAVMSLLLEEFFKNDQFDIREDVRFSSFVQNGLLHTDALTRKRAMFILKWVVDVSSKQKKKPGKDAWLKLDSFILLMESLEEKQLHVILPILPSIQEIIQLVTLSSDGQHPLHTSWLTTALTRAFNHDNKFVTKWAIETCLQLSAEKLKWLVNANWDFITCSLLSALGESHFYEKENANDDKAPVLVDQMREFFAKCLECCSKENARRFFKQIIWSLCKKNFGSIPFIYITETLSCIKLEGVVDQDLLGVIKTFLLSGISTFPTELKSTAHHLLTQVVLNCFDKDSFNNEQTWAELINFLKIAFGRGYITYGSQLWEAMREKIAFMMTSSIDGSFSDVESLAKNSLKRFLTDKTDDLDFVEEVGLEVLIAVDIIYSREDKGLKDTIRSILEPLVSILSKVGRNPYLSDLEAQRSVQIAEFIFRKCIESHSQLVGRPCEKQLNSITAIGNVLLEFVLPCLEHFRGALLSVLRDEERNMGLVLAFISLQRALSEYVVVSSVPSLGKSRPNSAVTNQLTTSTAGCYDAASNTHWCNLLAGHFHHLVDICDEDISRNREANISDKTNICLHSLTLVSDFISSYEKKYDDRNYGELEAKLINVIKALNLSLIAQSRFVTSVHEANQNDDISSLNSYNFCLWSLVSFALKNRDIKDMVAKRTSVESDVDNTVSACSKIISLGTCTIHQLTNCITDAIDVSVGRYLVPLLNCLEILVPYVHLITEEFAVGIIHASWRVFIEQKRRDNVFWIIYEPVVRILFSPCFLIQGSQEITRILQVYWREIELIGEAKSGAFNVLVNHCCMMWESCMMGIRPRVMDDAEAFNDAYSITNAGRNSLNSFSVLLGNACIFGKLQKKSPRILQQTINYVKLKYIETSTISNNSNNDYQVRTTVVKFLLGLDSESDENCEFISEFIGNLIEMDKEISEKSRRYYNNSVVHRQKLRIWQTVLVLLKFVLEEHACEIIDSTLAAMVGDNQPSVRYYMDWFVTLLVYKYPKLRARIWQKLGEATEKRISSITSVMSIIGHIAVILPHCEFSEMCSEAFIKLLPWIQVHHMQARIHAQVIIGKLWEEAKRRNLEEILNRFDIIQSLFTLTETNASVVRARSEMQNNFYFKYFHPLRHYSLENIFMDLPKLAGVAEDEILNVKQFSGLSNCLLMDLGSDDTPSSLLDEMNESWKQISCTEKQPSQATAQVLTDVQKKITAWKPLPPSDDPFLQKADMFKSETRPSDLILCASLVDRTPNLGGLCRTCEIFGVSTLTIGAMRYLDDASFKSLSVTSEKWLNIEQVIPRHLSLYLKDMKAKGYRVVGVEQTANSKALQGYEFEEKTLLLLGNEKEGIPVDLIQLVDDCVEIPQQGIIRSLNVHVSGAIIIWEYFKQTLAKNSK